MRISTTTLFESGTSKLAELQSGLMKAQQQIASGRRMLTPADDPVAAARAFDVEQAKSANTQYGINRQTANSSLALEEGVLQSVTSLLQDVKTLTVSAGNGTYSETERKFLATELQGRFEELLGLANAQDGQGGYLFAGFQSNSQPFSPSASGALYQGDQGERLLQVGAARQIALGDNGSTVFQMNKTGNGSFATSTAGSNGGTGIVSPGVVVDASLLTGHHYSVTFDVTGGVTTYEITDTTSNTVLSSGNPYTSGQAIAFDGMQFEVSGAPASGDSVAIAPSTSQSVFDTIKNLINVLNAPAGGAASQARLTNGLSVANGNIDNALDNVLTVRASVGARLKELQSLDDAGESANIHFAQTLSELQDLDYTKAISNLMQQQTVLSAAQQSFVKISNLSLFNFI